MSNDRNPETRNGRKQSSDGLTTIVLEELDPDDMNEIAGGSRGSFWGWLLGGGGGDPRPSTKQSSTVSPLPTPTTGK